MTRSARDEEQAVEAYPTGNTTQVTIDLRGLAWQDVKGGEITISLPVKPLTEAAQQAITHLADECGGTNEEMARLHDRIMDLLFRTQIERFLLSRVR